MAKTTIEWVQNPDGTPGMTWNPVRGCSRVSPGCDNCYAMRQAHRFSGPGQPYEGLTTIRRGRVDWMGRARFVPEQLQHPLRVRRPTTFFVNSMSDLFHESLTNEQIAAVFGVMAACPRHTFIVLTTRPQRMREWFRWLEEQSELSRAYGAAGSSTAEICRSAAIPFFRAEDGSMSEGPGCALLGYDGRRPLPNVRLGVSVEDQPTADERIPHLIKTPAAVRVVSIEPLLEPIAMRPHLLSSARPGDCKCGHGHGFTRCPNYGSVAKECHECSCRAFQRRAGEGIHWVLVGGETGPGARPAPVRAMQDIVRQCREAGVPVFMKQLGAKPMLPPHIIGGRHVLNPFPVRDRKGADISEWPDNLRVREFPERRS